MITHLVVLYLLVRPQPNAAIDASFHEPLLPAPHHRLSLGGAAHDPGAYPPDSRALRTRGIPQRTLSSDFIH